MPLPCPRLAWFILGLAAASVWAQTAPPIKPGLWEIRTEHNVDGKKAADPGDRLKNLPPAQRAQIEAMMKQRGVALSSGGDATLKICLSADSLAHDGWQGGDRNEHGQNGRCKSDVVERSGSTWKWHAACTDPEVVSDGVAEFTNGENYTVRLTNVTKVDGVPRTTQMAIAAKWLGSGCGDLKPAGAKP